VDNNCGSGVPIPEMIIKNKWIMWIFYSRPEQFWHETTKIEIYRTCNYEACKSTRVPRRCCRKISEHIITMFLVKKSPRPILVHLYNLSIRFFSKKSWWFTQFSETPEDALQHCCLVKWDQPCRWKTLLSLTKWLIASDKISTLQCTMKFTNTSKKWDGNNAMISP
jgi:hypothetical protein